MKNISLLTDLSNDLFLEIFDYIDVLQLFQAFFNLNQHLNLLIINRRICFQANLIPVKFDEFSIYRNLILPKIGCYIRYLTISDELNYLRIILRSISLTNLISVRLYDIQLNELRKILEDCKLKYLFIDTKYIQNEKDLNKIFQILFNQQSDLRSIQCNFHTNLYFLEDKYRLSQLRQVVIDCECFSSDFIVLICQLPRLRHISARINDYYRELMDKDVNHLIGNESLRSVILHIENIELNRLLFLLSLISNVHLLELNGKIDFDINYLFELERNYKSFRCNLHHYLTH
jgi:hypothetical protein